MTSIRFIAAICLLSVLSFSCGSEGSNKDQPMDSTSNIVLPEDRSSDSLGINPRSTMDSSGNNMDSSSRTAPDNTRATQDSVGQRK